MGQYYGITTLGDGIPPDGLWIRRRREEPTGSAGSFTQVGPLPHSTTSPALYAGRTNTFGSFTTTGAILKVEDTTASPGNLAEFWKQGALVSTLSPSGIWTATNPVQFKIADTGGQVYSAKAYGILADVLTSTGTINSGSTTLTVPNGAFSAADNGKWILVPGAGTAGSDLNATISNGALSGTTIALGTAAGTTATSVVVTYGTQNNTAIAALFATVSAAGGGTIVFPPGNYACHSISVPANVRLFGYGATLTKSGGTFVGLFTGATTATTSTLSGNATVSASTVAVTSATGFAKGDYALLFDSTYKYATTGQNQRLCGSTA